MVHLQEAREFAHAPSRMLVGKLPQPRDGWVIDLSSRHVRILRRGENVFICDIFVLYATGLL
jgi:hypothetical protein